MSDLVDELIRAKAEKAGATAELADAVAVLIRPTVEVRNGSLKILDKSGNVRVGGAAGGYSDMNLDELVAEIAAARPALFGRGKVETEAPTTPKPDTVSGVKITANPYSPATRNITHQALLEKHQPERAAKLRTEAGAIPAFIVNRPW